MKTKPRERIAAALQHKESDRIPVDLGSTDSSGIMGIAYNQLKKKLGIAGKTQIFQLMTVISKVEPEVLDKVGSDAISLQMEPKRWKSWNLQDGSSAEVPENTNIERLENGDLAVISENGNIEQICPRGSLYFNKVYHPLQDARTKKDIDANKKHLKSFDLPGYMDEGFDSLGQRAKKIYDETDYAIVGNLCVHLLAAGQELRGFENFMMDLAIDKPLAHYFLESMVETYIPRIDRFIEAAGKYTQVILVNDDMGTQKGLQVSPELYREMLKPYHKKLWNYVKEKSGKPLLLHSCGSIYDLIPDLIEMGIDAINPVQVSAKNMDSKKLKKEFGKDITFWGGGCDTQTILSRGKPSDVRQEVRKRIDDLAPGGGFVFCQVHNIQANIPVDNILAMYEEAGTLI